MKLSSITWDYPIPQLDVEELAENSRLSMDDQTFAAFYQRTARPVWTYLARVSGNAALADDLLQESYMRFLCAARWSEGEAACRRYLFRIATNLLRDHWRRRAPASLEEFPDEAFPAEPSNHADRIDSQAALAAAMVRMRPRERQLLWLAYAEGATHREIAEITGLRAAGIRILLFRARRKLARLLRQSMPSMERAV